MALRLGQVKEILNLAMQPGAPAQEILTELMRDSVSESYVVTHIKRGLAVTAEFEITLRTLIKAFPMFTRETLENHILHFIEAVMRNNLQSENKFKFISIVLSYSRSREDVIDRSVVLQLVPKFVEKCLKVEKGAPIESEALACLSACLEFYPSSCISFRERIVKHVVEYLGYENVGSGAVRQAARCFLYLQQCGPPGVDSINHTQNWSNSFRRLCLTFEELLSCVKDANHCFDDGREELVLFPLAVDTCSSNRLHILECRIFNVLTFISTFIECKFSTFVTIKPQYFIDLLEFTLSKQDQSIENSIEAYYPIAVQMRVMIRFFNVFHSFLVLLQLNLIPFSDKIMKILVNRLHESRGDQYRLKSDYKEALYKVISCFVKIMKNNIDRDFHRKLIEAIIDDVKPITENITLNATKYSKNNKNGNNNKVNSNHHSAIQEKICSSALDCLKDCFENFILNLTCDKLKKTYDTLYSTLEMTQRGLRPSPYTSSLTISKLYKVIVATLEQIHPPPLSAVTNLLLVGQSNNDPNISETCKIGLTTIEKICQPVRPLIFSKRLTEAYVESESNSEEAALSESVTLDKVEEKGIALIEEEDKEKEKNCNGIGGESLAVVSQEMEMEMGNEVVQEFDKSLNEERNQRKELMKNGRLSDGEMSGEQKEKIPRESSSSPDVFDMLSCFNDTPI